MENIANSHRSRQHEKKAYERRRYAKLRQRFQRNLLRRASQQERRDYINQLKSHPCTDCNGSFPPMCMQYDHRDPTTKTVAVAHLVFISCSIEDIDREIAKCDLVCANCHAIRTHRRKGGPRQQRDRKPFTHGTMYGWMRMKCTCEHCSASKKKWNDERTVARRKPTGYIARRMLRAA